MLCEYGELCEDGVTVLCEYGELCEDGVLCEYGELCAFVQSDRLFRRASARNFANLHFYRRKCPSPTHAVLPQGQRMSCDNHMTSHVTIT